MKKGNKDSDLSDMIGGTLNLFGLKIDLTKLLSSQEDVRERLGELREELKRAGGKETLSDEEWRSGEMGISGYLRTKGIGGETEYHLGTTAPPRGRKKAAGPADAVEPPTDVFDDGEEVVIVAEVPGVELAELKIEIEGDVVSLSTKPSAPRNYRKEVRLSSSVDKRSLKAACRNGILEVHLKKQAV